jgi:phospholipase C
MPGPDRSNALDHVVVLMFENRSFDNLLGRLCEPGKVESFEGVTGKDLSNPVPDWALDLGKRGLPMRGYHLCQQVPTAATMRPRPWPATGAQRQVGTVTS